VGRKKKKTQKERIDEFQPKYGRKVSKGFGGKAICNMEHIKYMKDNAAKEAEKRKDNKYMMKAGVTPRQRMIAFMAACGAGSPEIAESVGMTQKYIQEILRRPNVQTEIEKIQYRLFSNQAKTVFEEIMPSAIETALKIMLDENQKGGIRLNAAQDFMDRAAGKAVQRIEKEEKQLVSVLIGKLQNTMSKAIASSAKEDNNDYIDIEPPKEEAAASEEEVEDDSIDVSEWVDENI
jgi:hypothetical protein